MRELIGQRRAVLAGHSGVGKTTLSNAITGRADPTGAVNEVIGRGRQTTTVARLIDLPGGGELIDTAGVRSFGIADVTPEELQEAFPEIAAVSGRAAGGPACTTRGRTGAPCRARRGSSPSGSRRTGGSSRSSRRSGPSAEGARVSRGVGRGTSGRRA